MISPALWTSREVAAAVGGETTRPWRATGVSIDTRSLRKKDLFIALAGPRYDGHAFVEDAFTAGAVAAVVSGAPANTGNSPQPLVRVNNTLAALYRLGETARQRTAARIVAITGSVGKTGTKEALAHVLGRQGLTCASRQSLNNHWGVPLSLARMAKDTRFGIFEIGMNHAGEITPLVQLVRPDIAVVTAIAPAHMAYFESIDDIARAKAEIFSGLDGGTAVIPRDSGQYDLLAAAARLSGADTILSFGKHPEADVRLVATTPNGSGTCVSASCRGRGIDFRVGLPGVHWTSNALAVLATVAALDADMTAAAADLATLPPLPGRGAIHTLQWGDGTIRLIDDSYNANPTSMQAALETLGRMVANGGRRVAILGDMLELGAISYDAHAGLDQHIERNRIDVVFLVGREMRHLENRLHPERIGGVAEDVDQLLPLVMESLAPGDVVTVKASNGIRLATLVNTLLAECGQTQ